MLDCLPQTVEPLGLADAGRSFRGQVAVGAMQRLRPLLADDDASLQVQLRFKRDERLMRVMHGSIDGEIRLICQRCMEPLSLRLQFSFALGIVEDESELDYLPEGYDPLLAGSSPLTTSELVEDEVLLAIPAVPVHSGEQRCEAAYLNPPAVEKVNPFSVLEKLKTDR